MKTKEQIKIETLTAELQKEKLHLEENWAERENLLKDICKYEADKKRRNYELETMKTILDELKKSIPDFSQEIFMLYLKYNVLNEEYQKTIKFCYEIDERLQKWKEEVCSKETYIKYGNQRISQLTAAIKEAESEEK